MSRYQRLRYQGEREPTPITLAPNLAQTVDSALTLIGASLQPDAADTYLPRRIISTLARLHSDGIARTWAQIAQAEGARERLARAFSAPPPAPTPAPDEAASASAIAAIQRNALALSDPPPQRHVAYFTHQLRAAFSQAYQQGWNRGRDRLHDSVHALDQERRAAPDPATDDQHHALEEAQRIVRTLDSPA